MKETLKNINPTVVATHTAGAFTLIGLTHLALCKANGRKFFTVSSYKEAAATVFFPLACAAAMFTYAPPHVSALQKAFGSRFLSVSKTPVPAATTPKPEASPKP